MTEAAQPQTRWRVWLLALLLALLWQVVIMSVHFDWTRPSPPMPVDIHQVDPAKLAQIKKQWKERDKALLLDKKQPISKEAPKDARYMSEHNIKVDKEQRARDTNVIPQAGRPGPKAQETRPKEKAAPKEPVKTATMPKLGNLGVPFRLTEPAKPKPEEQVEEAQRAQRAADDGGDQALQDNKLPVGSENMLNATESVYYSFFARLYEAIGPVWQSRVRSTIPSRRLVPGDYTTVVDVVLDAEGNLIAVRQLQSSGVPEFDRAVDVSWHKIGRFPNPPQGLLKNGEVHTGWNFSVQLDQTLTPDYLPPERAY